MKILGATVAPDFSLINPRNCLTFENAPPPGTSSESSRATHYGGEKCLISGTVQWQCNARSFRGNGRGLSVEDDHPSLPIRFHAVAKFRSFVTTELTNDVADSAQNGTSDPGHSKVLQSHSVSVGHEKFVNSEGNSWSIIPYRSASYAWSSSRVEMSL